MKRKYLLFISAGLSIFLLSVIAFLIVDTFKYEANRNEISDLANSIQSDINDVDSMLDSSKKEEDSAQIRTISQDNVELKSESSVNSKTIRTFVAGENVFPTNKILYNEVEYWVQVRDRNGVTGWILEEQLK